MAHITLSPQMVTAVASLLVSVLTWVAANATGIVSAQYAPVVAFLAGSIAAFITHNYYTAQTPTSNAGAVSTVAGPPAP